MATTPEWDGRGTPARKVKAESQKELGQEVVAEVVVARAWPSLIGIYRRVAKEDLAS